MMHDSNSPSQWYHLGEFWLVYHGLYMHNVYSDITSTLFASGCKTINIGALAINFELTSCEKVAFIATSFYLSYYSYEHKW